MPRSPSLASKAVRNAKIYRGFILSPVSCVILQCTNLTFGRTERPLGRLCELVIRSCYVWTTLQVRYGAETAGLPYLSYPFTRCF